MSTILPALFRRIKAPAWQRERLELADGDFLDLDWARRTDRQPRPLLILSHGLEGSTDGQYIKGMARLFLRRGYDILAWNFRGCSGEPNRLLRMYHSGASADLAAVIKHALGFRHYKEIALAGFSMGGNITLKYVGQRSGRISRRIKAAVAFSVPLHLESCAYELALWDRRIYMWQFLRSLRLKLEEKATRFGDQIDVSGLAHMRTFFEFDDAYTGPLHGFKDARDYWTRSSAINWLADIKIPTLLVNAADDPFLGGLCYPAGLARQSPAFYLEVPRHGGHVGFGPADREGQYWSERRAWDFISDFIPPISWPGQ
ncbi:MAG: alpha/beta fold hydrolase [Leptospiraceae bacterium]|nr:alpha/beta fold hydrolase [Leptospiraceae bacterium]